MSTTMTRLLARVGSTAVAGAVLLVAPGLTATQAAVPSGADPTAAAAHFLATQLHDQGDLLAVEFGGALYPDYGLSADAVLALDAAGAGQGQAAKTTALLQDHVIDYTGFGDPSEVSAGAVAKLINVAVAQHISPAAFGGRDLLAMLTALQQPNGRFTDQTAYTDYSNTFTQTFAVIGLLRGAGTVSADAVEYLATQQCPGGGFPLTLSDAGCTDDANADPDATAMALQALVMEGSFGPAVVAGLDYLESVQGAAGGVGGAGPTAAHNANSTGLAAQAFVAGGRTDAAAAARSYLASLQYGCEQAPSLRGGIGYDETSFGGVGSAPTDQDRRSTAQALAGLAGVPLYAVDKAGAATDTVGLTCPTQSATPTPSKSTTTTTTTTAAPPTTSAPGTTSAPASTPVSSSAPAATAAGGVASGPTTPATTGGSLAYTGGDLLVPTGLGVVLLVVGGLAVVLSRREGAHR